MRHKRSKEDLNKNSFKKAWLTRGQLMKLYGGQEDVVTALIAKKISEGLCKPHPDLPSEPSAMLYQARVLMCLN